MNQSVSVTLLKGTRKQQPVSWKINMYGSSSNHPHRPYSSNGRVQKFITQFSDYFYLAFKLVK